MASRRATTCAVVAVLLLSIAGLLTVSGGGAASAGVAPGFDGERPTCHGVASSASVSSDATSEDPVGAYRELTTCPVSEARQGSASRDERASGTDRSEPRPLHRWRCPICEETKTSFATPGRDSNEEAANNLRSHVRTTDGNGHGPPGEIPETMASSDLEEYVSVFELAG